MSCEHCDFERGGGVVPMWDYTEGAPALLRPWRYISRVVERHGACGIEATIYGGDMPVAGLAHPINYCPMCGRDLRKEG